jgi:membrane fusion protein (multidrug efflux system)
MRKSIVIGVLSLLLLGLAGGGLWWWTVARFVVSTDNAYVEADMAVMSPKLEGYVAEVVVADNQKVESGQVLVRLVDDDYRAKLAEAEAQFAADQAALATAVKQVELQQSVIAEAEALVVSAEAELVRAEQDYRRKEKMVAARVVGQDDYDQAEAAWRKAQAEVARTQAALVAERGRLAVQEAARVEAEAAVARAEAQRQLAQQDLDNTVIRAPFAGTVGNRAVEVGQYVRAGTALMAVVPLPEVYVVANFKETQIERLIQGQSVEIDVDAFPGQTLVGHVESFSPASGALFSLLPPENATGNFTKIVQRLPVRIAVDDQPLKAQLKPGMSVVVSIDTRTPDGALAATTSPAAGATSSAAAP